MEISDVLCPETIDLSEREFKNKDDSFVYLTDMLYNAGFVSDTDEFIDSLYEREEQGTTYMGDNLAVPHGWCSCVKRPVAVLCRCKPFTYVSADNAEEVDRIAMLAVPKDTASNDYMRTLATLAKLLMNENFALAFKTAKSADELIACANREEKNL